MLNETTKKLTISPLKAFAAILLFSLASMVHAQDSNLLTGNLSSVGMAGRSGVVITLSIVSPLNRTWNGTNVSNDPLWATSSVPAGDFQFRNVIWGKYRLQAGDSSGTLWTLYVGTNTVGTVPIASLITNAAAIPPSPATNYYTQVQIDALISSHGHGTTYGTNYPNSFSSVIGGLYVQNTNNSFRVYINTNGLTGWW